MPHVLTLVEQFWHKVPGGTARATERTLAALLDHTEFTITGVAAAHRSLGVEGGQPADNRWARVPSGVSVHHSRLPRPLLYESWLRIDWPGVDHLAPPHSVFWASSLIVAPTSLPVVSTVHDLDFLTGPELLSRRGRGFFPRMWTRARTRSQLFVCPSRVVAEQCIRQGVPEAAVRVVPWGVDQPLCPPDQVDDTLDRLITTATGAARLPDRFVLLVAPDQPRKNPIVSAEALAAVDCAAVVVGSEPQLGQPDHFASLGRNIIRLGSVTDHQLSALYRRATVLLFPSLAEGFGLPVGEAMAHGLPVVTSSGTATEEVADGAAVLVDPHDAGAVGDALQTVLDDGRLRRELSCRGPVRAAELTWTATAEGYAEAFEAVR